jgi:hypothetical protein
MSTTPEELPVGATPIFSGYLYKQSTWIRDWRKRFFTLYIGPSGPRLYFSKDQTSPPHGMIDLRFCLTVKSADEKTQKTNSFEVATKEDVFFMYAPTALEKDEVRRTAREEIFIIIIISCESRSLTYPPSLPPLSPFCESFSGSDN